MKNNRIVLPGPFDPEFRQGGIFAIVILLLGLASSLGIVTASLQAEIPAADGGPPVPVIDMHTHVFNARGLPLFGVLNSRRKPVMVPPLVAQILKSVLTAWTPVDYLDESLHELPAPNLKREELLRAKMEKSRRYLEDDERKTLASFVGRPDLAETRRRTAKEMDLDSIKLVALALKRANIPPNENRDEKNSRETAPYLLGLVDFLDIMTDGNRRIAWRLKTEEYPKADLFVHHMMDMEKGYGELPARPFAEQMTRMMKLDRSFEGKLLHFVAFEPFRRETSLENVKLGLGAGADGVKIYPPTGHRATNNAIPRRPFFAS